MKQPLEKIWMAQLHEVSKEIWAICKFYPKLIHIHCLMIAVIFGLLTVIVWPKNLNVESAYYFFVYGLSHSFDLSLVPMLFVVLIRFHRNSTYAKCKQNKT